MQSFRISLRQMLVFVSIVGFFLVLIVWINARRIHFLQIAKYHESRIATRGIGGITETFYNVRNEVIRNAQVSPQWQDWHRRMKAKYTDLARHPWLPTGSDFDEPPPEMAVPVDWSEVKQKILAGQAR